MGMFRKKPVVTEALKWDGTMDSMETIKAHWPKLETLALTSHPKHRTVQEWSIRTLEGRCRVDVGDWVLLGVAGEYYPCKPGIFEAIYEVADTLMDLSPPSVPATTQPEVLSQHIFTPYQAWLESLK